MNICVFSGKVITNVDFKFIINTKLSFKDCKNISIAQFKMKLNNNVIIKVKAYDELADFCYKNLHKGNFILISGNINDIFEVESDFCEIF